MKEKKEKPKKEKLPGAFVARVRKSGPFLVVVPPDGALEGPAVVTFMQSAHDPGAPPKSSFAAIATDAAADAWIHVDSFRGELFIPAGSKLRARADSAPGGIVVSGRAIAK
jgi:hypothetical protein